MKISIVSPVYNESKNIDRFFNAISKLDYPKEDFEVVITNDGSTDDSLFKLQQIKEVSDFNLKIVDLGKNCGRAIAIEEAFKAATYENILLIGFKNSLQSDALKEVKKANYQPIKGTVIFEEGHIYETFFNLIRHKIYQLHDEKDPRPEFVSTKNFDSVPTGTTLFFCDRQLFLDCQVNNKSSKHCSDDTKLLWNMVQKRKILVGKKIICSYQTRSSLSANIKHIYERGPKFIDFYYKVSKKPFWIINFGLIVLASMISLIVINPASILPILISLLIFNCLASLYFGGFTKNFFLIFVLLPLFGTLFFAGTIHGLLLKLFNLGRDSSNLLST